ncbi:hypothetical protein J2X11_001420 [Aeromicrobium panaciterrae]|uniref:Sugar phosphotransferase n=1 Tax=Aeromicrobium panaciterrae TaxID=363861 RepID=A0ABU1UN23_9ACTN|nr:stealth conserved region 3 domain-containing protein [Aeromicrobium panaciterrae]MDR7086581.1 hypothetical protein [Aeromicrobium panaciterrae]
MTKTDAYAESSGLVRIYRSLLSANTRARIDRRVPLRLRFAVKRIAGLGRVVPTPARVAFAVASRAHRSFYRGEGRALALDGVRHVAALADTAQSPLESRRKNLLTVLGALEAAGIDHFCVRGLKDTTSTVAVASDDWAAVTSLLSQLASDTTGYLALVYGDAEPVEVRGRPGYRRLIARRAHAAAAVRVAWFRTDSTGRAVYGERYSCEIQRWERSDGGRLTAPLRNAVAPFVSDQHEAVLASDSLFTRLAPADRNPLPDVRTRIEFTDGRPDDVLFPIDVVFTWVDGADAEWQRKRAEHSPDSYHEESANETRYRSRDELKYALRSIEMNAPWVRNIYVVTDDQRPSWLDESVPGLTLVDHRDIFSDTSVLPTFNSHAIETQLHHIEGLSEHFIYFNDDMMLGAEVIPQHFFHANGITKFFLSPVNEPQGDPTADDVPVTIAAKNNRRLLKQHFGTSLTQKMKHVPYALRKSVLEEIEAKFSDEIRVTMGNKARSRDDISLLSSFYQHYAFSTGRAVPGRIRYSYLDLRKGDARRTMGLLLAMRDQQAFCANATSVGEQEVTAEELREFLESYFPVPSRFER